MDYTVEIPLYLDVDADREEFEIIVIMVADEERNGNRGDEEVFNDLLSQGYDRLRARRLVAKARSILHNPLRRLIQA